MRISSISAINRQSFERRSSNKSNVGATKNAGIKTPDYQANIAYDEQSGVYTISGTVKNDFDSPSWFYLYKEGNAAYATAWDLPRNVPPVKELKEIYNEISQKTQNGTVDVSRDEAMEIYDDISNAVKEFID